jgi:hypothetical protein
MKRMGAAAATAALAFPAVANAAIVVNRGMSGVNIGETQSAVRQALGSPTLVNHDSGRTLWFYYNRVLITFNGKHRAVGLYTESRAQRTANGLGVGSTKAAVKRLVPGVQCSSNAPLPGVDCIVIDFGRRVSTDFSIGKKGHVTGIGIFKN